MASKQSTVDYIVDQLASAGAVSSKKMFGEYGVYLDGKMFALVCDDQLFLRPTVAGRAFIGTPTEAPPYPTAKPHFLISGDRWDDGEWLSELARLTAQELPLPKKKTPARSKLRAE
jgi:TfoX/Sxy family transcriptional regulator of competence genes